MLVRPLLCGVSITRAQNWRLRTCRIIRLSSTCHSDSFFFFLFFLFNSPLSFDLNTIRYCQNDLLQLFCAGKALKDPEQLRQWKERFVLYYVTYVERFLEAQPLKSSGPDAPALLEVEKANLDAMHR